MKKAHLFLIPCGLSLSRALVALLVFLQAPLSLPLMLAWAVLSDVLDGFLARLWHAETRLGAYLDPFADKLFALAFVYHFYEKGLISAFALFALFSRDLSLILFGCMLFCQRRLSSWNVQSFFLGKVATSLQFLAFGFLLFNHPIPTPLLIVLSLVGLGSLGELYWRAARGS